LLRVANDTAPIFHFTLNQDSFNVHVCPRPVSLPFAGILNN